MASTGDRSAVCTDCGGAYPDGSIDPPCAHCGSSRRTVLQSLHATVKPTATLDWLRTDQAQRPLGYGDSGTPGVTRHGNAEADGTIALILEGRPPQNEQDTAGVCQTLAVALSDGDDGLTAVACGDRDTDGELRRASETIPVQVVKALSEMSFWKTLALKLRIEQRLTTAEAIHLLKAAVESKARSLPAAQRAKLILALDADRLPALALAPVVEKFRAEQGEATRTAGFRQVWIVGPDARLTWRLDA